MCTSWFGSIHALVIAGQGREKLFPLGSTKLLSVLADSSNGVGLVAAKDRHELGLGAPLSIVMLLVLATDNLGSCLILVFLGVD